MYGNFSISLLPLATLLLQPAWCLLHSLANLMKTAKLAATRVPHAMALLFMVNLVPKGHAARVLIYPFGHCLNSHLLNAEKLAAILAGSGHHVTMLLSTDYFRLAHVVHGQSLLTGPGVERNLDLRIFEAPKNYTPICEYDTVDFMLYSPFQTRFNTCVQTFERYCDTLLANTKLIQSLKVEQFDAFIVEALDPCSRVLADYIDVPFIPLVTTGLGHFDSNPRPPSYLPAVISSFTPRMTFLQRLANMVMKVMYENVPVIMGFDAPFEQLKHKYLINTSLSIADTFKRSSLKLVNSNFAIEYPAPVEPDTILVGGFAIKSPQTLQGQLKAFVDNAPDGVIVMSFGTLVASFNRHWASIFAETFARIPQRVIWRFKEDSPESVQNYNFSSNVLALPWIPQVDLLAHRNTRLFITHCGMNGMYETAYFGVPVVAVPLSADQYSQASKMVDYIGMGVQADIETLTSDDLVAAINEVLNNTRYQDNADMASARFQDQPLAMSETLNYWVEYVVRHRGAYHLKSSARYLTWYQYHSIDILLFILTCVLIMGFTFVKTSCKLCNFVSKNVFIKTKCKLHMS